MSLPQTTTHFEFNSREISQSEEKVLRKFAQVVGAMAPNSKLEITGHTDRIGSDWYNNQLSLQRASAVADILKVLGLKNPTEVRGKGETQPLPGTPNNDVPTPDNIRAQAPNRRVEIKVEMAIPKGLIGMSWGERGAGEDQKKNLFGSNGALNIGGEREKQQVSNIPTESYIVTRYGGGDVTVSFDHGKNVWVAKWQRPDMDKAYVVFEATPNQKLAGKDFAPGTKGRHNLDKAIERYRKET